MASIVIMMINIVGGVLIGILYHQMRAVPERLALRLSTVRLTL